MPKYANAYLLKKNKKGLFDVSTITINPNILNEYKDIEKTLQTIKDSDSKKDKFNFWQSAGKTYLETVNWSNWKINIKLTEYS